MQKNTDSRDVKFSVSNWIPIFIAGAFLVVVDQFLKTKVLLDQFNWSVRESFLIIDLHKNTGGLFNTPIPIALLVIISIIIGFLLGLIAYKKRHESPQLFLASILILIGGAGNLFDRVVYGFTVDYLIFFEKTALNISDIVILIGVLIAFFPKLSTTTIDKTQKND